MTSNIPNLAQEVHAEVARKREAGAYPPEVLAEVDQPSEVVDPGGDMATDDLTSALAELTRSGYFTARVTADSKKPYIGPVVARGRRMIRGALTWYMNGILQQVRNFAGNVDRTVTIVARRTNTLAARVDALEKEVAELRERLAQRNR